ncbi:MAG: AAA family ATPase [Bernardetiaceae bacterium]|nr:AAA family ATPase [Bernardetiaceae bacterium]
MIHYFLNLPKDYDLTFDKNIVVSKAIMHTAKNAFSPFYQYLQTSIKALERKEEIKAKWKKVKQDNLVELKIIGGLFEIPKTTKIKLLKVEKGVYTIIGIKDEDFDEPLICWINGQKKKIPISQNDFISNDKIKLPFEYEKIEKSSWAGEPLKLEPSWIVLNPNDKISQNGIKFKVKSIQNDLIEIYGILENSKISYNNKTIDFEIISKNELPKNCKIIKDDANRFVVYSEKANSNNLKLYNLLHKENLKFENGEKFHAEHHENMTFKISDNSVIGKRVVCDNVKFTIAELYKKDKNQFWIQLEELDETDDDIPGFSPLKYFFDDDISIKDDAGNEYSLFQGIESEYKLILKEKNNQNRFQNFCFPKGKILQVRVNTYQLRKQSEAISTLQNMPVGEHSNLIKLFEKREVVKWHEPEPDTPSDWIVLTDDNRSGAKEQRNFVKQAIETPDFAILEGPPGSGKTTVILELICQLAKQGKRILLCGSTHVAIDNVLERLHEKRNGEQTLIQKFNILPVRIGDENRINEDVKEFQIDNLIEYHQISQDLLLEASNLVCGTTIGILQHPHFKNRKQKSFFFKGEKKTYFEEPIIPDFDYLIIDESSKTTFQEFLVPALYAKKWILAGDVMQLSPFTDREQIVANLESLQLKDGETLTKEYQLAVFYLHKILEITKYAKNKFVLPVPDEVIDAFLKELMHRKIEEKTKITIFDNEQAKLKLTASDIIIIEESILKDNLHNLPETHAILRYENWQTSEHAFIHNYWQNKGNNFKLRIKGKKLENSFEIVEDINKFFKEKSWAEEIAWRVDREHQLRLLDDSKTKNYRKVIEELIPVSLGKEDIGNRIHTIATIAFPSILESLIKGIPARFKQTETTISKGFSPQELKHRRTVLTYQHRMHPDISKFPREQFYKKENALLDLENPKSIDLLRQWSYTRYSKRSIWIDVKGKTVRNYNEAEAKVLISELEKFIEFAGNNEQPEGKEWTVACLTFYKGQEAKIREGLQKLTGRESAFSNFNIEKKGKKINIKLHSVDKFQGHEADIVFLSMVQTHRDGFMDNPNRLNVAITRAKFQLVIFGDYNYFAQKSRSEDLKQLATNTQILKTNS